MLPTIASLSRISLVTTRSSLGEVLAQVLDELARTVGALDLPVGEHVHLGQSCFFSSSTQRGCRPSTSCRRRRSGRGRCSTRPRDSRLDHLRTQLVGARDHRAARLARVEERVAVDLARDGVVDDEARLEAFVLLREPGIDPEGLDADDLLLLVAHRAGDIHHVDDDGVGHGLGDRLPGAEALVVGDGHDDGFVGANEPLAIMRFSASR
jgi:hypothetical protein